MANEKRLIDATEARKHSTHDIITHFLDRSPTVDAVPLSEVYRLIAGHSNYHGDNILSALTCIAEGKEVTHVRPLPTVDAVEVVHGEWKEYKGTGHLGCSVCWDVFVEKEWLTENRWKYCPNCGAKMDGGNEDG